MRPGLLLALLSSEGLLLIALGVGYIVCAMASKQEKAMKTTGLIIGTIIIVLSVLFFIAKAAFLTNLPIKRAGGTQTPTAQQAPVNK